jgi:ABC-type transport system involved in multi-copper enzyme maturation permease subunit
MNPTIFVTALRQRFTSIPRLLLVGAVFAGPILFAMMVREIGLQGVRTGPVFAFLLGAGILGQETSSGVMQLLFARPVRRWQYVLTRWLAIAAAASALVLAQIAITCLVVAAHGLPPAREILALAGDQVLQAVGTTSVILFFSSFLSGVGDVLGIVLTFMTAQIAGAVAQFREMPWLARASAEVMRFLGPQFPLGPMLNGGGVPWFELVSYVSTVTLCLAVAMVVLDRREISYASE